MKRKITSIIILLIFLAAIICSFVLIRLKSKSDFVNPDVSIDISAVSGEGFTEEYLNYLFSVALTAQDTEEAFVENIDKAHRNAWYSRFTEEGLKKCINNRYSSILYRFAVENGYNAAPQISLTPENGVEHGYQFRVTVQLTEQESGAAAGEKYYEGYVRLTKDVDGWRIRDLSLMETEAFS